MYYILIPNKEKYDKLIIKVNIEIIEFEWLKNYNKIKLKLENGETISRINNKYLYDWL